MCKMATSIAALASISKKYVQDPNLNRHFLKGCVSTGRTLGKGAFGMVVELQMSGTRYAGKQIHDILLGVDLLGVSNIIDKFAEECRLMTEAKHPNIVQFMGICILDGCNHPMLVMEYMDMSLDHFIQARQGHIPLSLKYRILRDVDKGLFYLHTHDPIIIHRDVTARNILLSNASLQAKIADLGNALMTDPNQLMNTLSKMPGTALYMPPEAAGIKPVYDASLDMFSFGHLSLYVAIEEFPTDLLPATCTDPATEKIKGYSEIERRQLYIPKLYKVEDLKKGHPFCEMILSCLRNLPSKRPTAEEVLEILDGVVCDHEDPYSTFDSACRLDLIELAHKPNRSFTESIDNDSYSIHSHPARTKVKDLMGGIPGVMDIYKKRGGFKLGAATMEWKQYVFKIENKVLKYYKSNKPNKSIGELELQKVKAVSTFQSEAGTRFPFLVRFDSGSTALGLWRLSTYTAEERFSWMEAIRPGSASGILSDNSYEDVNLGLAPDVSSQTTLYYPRSSSVPDDIYITMDNFEYDIVDPVKTLPLPLPPSPSSRPKLPPPLPASNNTNEDIGEYEEILPEELLDRLALSTPQDTNLVEPLYVDIPPEDLMENLGSNSPQITKSDDAYESLRVDQMHNDDDDPYEDLKVTENSAQTNGNDTTIPAQITPEDRQRMEEIYETIGRMLGKSASVSLPATPDTPLSMNFNKQTSKSSLGTQKSTISTDNSDSLAADQGGDCCNTSDNQLSNSDLKTSIPKEEDYLTLSKPQNSNVNSSSSACGILSSENSAKNSEKSSVQQATTIGYENVYEQVENVKPVPMEPKLKPPVPKPRKLLAKKLTRPVDSDHPSFKQDTIPQKSLTSLEMLVHSDDDDSEYTPRPEWAKAATLNASLKEEDSLEHLQEQALFIQRSRIQNLEPIGQGNYGQVYKADYSKKGKKEHSIIVAVKTIKKYESKKAHDDFLKEMSIMAKFAHPNVIKLYGIVQEDSPWIVLEYLEKGDLRTFLQKNPRPVSILVNYMLDIAVGMHYIAEKGLVHRDLAARNIILNAMENCKISDFGLLREIPKDDSIYVSQNACPVPVRWMAPESLLRREFSTATDVWSYGILLWELSNPSHIPYKKYLTSLECATHVIQGERLNIPQDYPETVKKIMKACWQKEPSKRPSFLLISNLVDNEITFQ